MASTIESRVSTLFEERLSSGAALFFVQGLWRSGTGWVGRMLGSHPQVYVCQHELQSYMRELTVTQFGKPLADHPFLRERYEIWRKAGFLSVLLHLQRCEKPEAVLIGERRPGGDVSELKRAFPASRLVIILRDGRDIAVSTAFLDPVTPADSPRFDSGSPARLAPGHVEATAHLYASNLADYFAVKRAYPNDVALVRYEDLHANVTSEMRALLEFLRLGIDDAALAALCLKHAFSAESRQADPNDARYFRKGAVGDWHSHFSPESLAAFERIAGPALQQAGYALGTSAAS